MNGYHRCDKIGSGIPIHCWHDEKYAHKTIERCCACLAVREKENEK